MKEIKHFRGKFHCILYCCQRTVKHALLFQSKTETEFDRFKYSYTGLWSCITNDRNYLFIFNRVLIYCQIINTYIMMGNKINGCIICHMGTIIERFMLYTKLLVLIHYAYCNT